MKRKSSKRKAITDKEIWFKSPLDEIFEGAFVYRHHEGKPHPCEFSCNTDHPLNRRGSSVAVLGRRLIICDGPDEAAEVAKLCKEKP